MNIEELEKEICTTISTMTIERAIDLYYNYNLKELILDCGFEKGRIDILETMFNKDWQPTRFFISCQLNVPDGINKFEYDIFLSIYWLYNKKCIEYNHIPEVFKSSKLC